MYDPDILNTTFNNYDEVVKCCCFFGPHSHLMFWLCYLLLKLRYLDSNTF